MATGAPSERPSHSGLLRRWKWRCVYLLALAVGVCLAAVAYRPWVRLLGGEAGSAASQEPAGPSPVSEPPPRHGSASRPRVGDKNFDYQSTALIEVVDNRPLSERRPDDLERDAFLAALLKDGDCVESIRMKLLASDVRTRLLTGSVVRKLLLSGTVPFGRDVRPHDVAQLDLVHHAIRRRTRVTPAGPSHIAVSYRSRNPEFNAAIVNELVKVFLKEQLEQAQERAKAEANYHREKLAGARARLAEVDNQICEFVQAHPWLRDADADLHMEYKEARKREHGITALIVNQEVLVARLKENLLKETEGSATRKRLQADLATAEKDLATLDQRKHAASQEANLLYGLYRRAPELTAQRSLLGEQRSVCAAAVEELAKDTRAAERELQRLMTDAYGSRYRVVEHARPSYTPAEPEAEDENPASKAAPGEAVADLWLKHAVYAMGLGVVLGAVLSMLVVAALSVRRSEPSPGGARSSRRSEPSPGSAPHGPSLGVALVGTLCLVLPVATAIAGAALYQMLGAAGPRGAAPAAGTEAAQAAPATTAKEALAAAKPKEGKEPWESPLLSRKPNDFVGQVDIRFIQLDANVLVTGVVYAFREVLPENATTFLVVPNPDDRKKGTIAVYRLRNVATGEVFEFRDVPVVLVSDVVGWAIEAEVGWKQIHDELQAKMKTQLSPPILGP